MSIPSFFPRAPYLICIVLSSLCCMQCVNEKTMTSAQHQRENEEIKSSYLPGPFELFLLDRNYPSTAVSKTKYQSGLQQLMSYDRAHQHQNRQLQYPWTLEGPGNIGGRVNAVAVHPDDADVMFLGYSQGGIYRTIDGGENWIPVFDDQPALSIAHISFDPHDPSHIWVATGDVNISGFYWLGAGVFDSHDMGLTWTYRGLGDAGILSKVMADPVNPDIVYAGSMGFPSHDDQMKGFYRSADGGVSWTQTLFVDDSTGIIDMAIDPVQPGRLYATAWTRIRSNTKGTTVGPGTGVYKSEDFGETWIQLQDSLPASNHSRTGVEVTNDGTVFVSYVGNKTATECGNVIEDIRNIYKSTDGGMTWDTVPTGTQHNLPCSILGQFGWYFETMKINPSNPDDICLLGISMYRSLDGGIYWTEVGEDFIIDVHADKHDLVFAHGNMFLGTDGGAYKIDVDMFNGWTDIENIPSTQFYRTTWNPHTPSLYFGGAQDNGTTGGNVGSFNEWPRLFGGDGFQPLFDPTEPTWLYVTTQNGNVWFSEDGGADFDWLTSGMQGDRYWDMPFVMSPHNPKILYGGSYQLYKMNMNGVRAWEPFSPDLTRGETILGGRYPTITAIAVSPLDSMRIYAGTQDGLVWTTADGGQNWSNITEGTPGVFVTSITCSTVDELGVIVTYSGYRDNDHNPYIYRSRDAGLVWEPVAADLPMMGVNNLMILPGTNDGVWIVGTDGGVYVTLDEGIAWHRVGNNMPYMPVYDIDFNPAENKIIAATFSRGIMTFPVEELELVSDVEDVEVSESDLKIKVFPTLAADHIQIEIPHSQQGSWSDRVEIYSAAGELILSEKINKIGSNKIAFPAAIKPGVYFAVVRNDSRPVAGKFIVM